MMVKLKPIPTIPATAVLGGAIAFLLRETESGFSGFTVTSPKATYYIGGNVVCFWGVLGATAIVCLLLWRKVRRVR